jgi:hypothetical protein
MSSSAFDKEKIIMKIPYALSLAILCLSCGDIIKAKDPRPDRKPYQPITLTDQTGICPYYPAVWKGRCTGQNQDLDQIISLDLAQTGCTLFAINSVAVYGIAEDRNYKQGEKAVTSRANWLNAERSLLELKEEWSDTTGKFIRVMTVDHNKGEALEKLGRITEDGQTSTVSSCFYQRS